MVISESLGPYMSFQRLGRLMASFSDSCGVYVWDVVLDGVWVFFFFFFQAEDGIRDWSVTGVQTCALPISSSPEDVRPVIIARLIIRHAGADSRLAATRAPRLSAVPRAAAMRTATSGVRSTRSEERRVGKGCRGRGSPGPYERK